ncbi:MAG TPA: AAA family ATPase, partial [Chitinophagaceae bacterium]|nr:AAA family ATPase [Chitinophagaceae bacterium]
NKKWLKSRTTKLLSLLEKMNKGNEAPDAINFIEHFKKDNLIYDEPQLFFHELADLFGHAELMYQKKIKGGDVFKDINYLRLRMKLTPLSNYRGDEISIIEKILKRFIKTLRYKEYKDDSNTIIIHFIWEALLFSLLLYLSGLSEKGKTEIEALFSEFDPVKNGVKLQNESERFISSVKVIIGKDAERSGNAAINEGRELSYITEAVENFVPGYSNLRVKRSPRPQMLVDKDGETMSLEQLSDGEKNVIALVGDIARRLSIANSNSNKPLEGKGIILIDEIDLHLHPSWQRLMIPKLTELFPNCQFFVTTHSPQVLSHVHPENIFLLRNEKNVFTYSKAIESYGQNSDRILEDLLGVDARPTKEKEMLHNLFKLIQNDNLKQAKIEVEKLSKLIGNDPEIVKAEVLIKRKEIIGK